MNIFLLLGMIFFAFLLAYSAPVTFKYPTISNLLVCLVFFILLVIAFIFFLKSTKSEEKLKEENKDKLVSVQDDGY